MNCAECRESLVGYIEEFLEDGQKGAVASHLEGCPPCRAELAQLIELHDRLTTNGRALAQKNLENSVFDRILREQSLKLKKTKKIDIQFLLWRKIMKSKIAKFAAAAAIIIVAGLLITFLGTSKPAYALDQTIKPNHSVRYLHVRDFTAGVDEPKEFWVECDEFGAVKCARLDIPEWESPEDGAKIAVWKEYQADVWFKKKNFFGRFRDKLVADRMLKMVEECDPKLAVERLYEQQTQGKVAVDINEPPSKTEPIVVTATYLEGSPTRGRRLVLFVDQATKLVTAIESYHLRDGEYRYLGTQEYYDYNQPIDPEMFSLEDEVPDDVTVIDQVAQEVGLAQGTLSDDEIAVEVARRFFEALIAQDYAAAGKLLEGMPADFIKKQFGSMRFLRIVSVGPAGPHPIPETQGLVVPCTVEVEKEGQTSEWKLERLGVRQVYGQPGRWTIFGGI
ncbi:MAG: hypothetical protein ACYSW4_06905 [Planctomycetota bacterium]|jgi:hypothetical protein